MSYTRYSPKKSIFRRILFYTDNIMRKYPWSTSIWITTGKTAAADLMVQLYIERKSWNDIDWTRNSVFIGFGFLYLGCFQYFLYNIFYWKLFPTKSLFHTSCKVFWDQIINPPLLYFPCYYIIMESLNNKLINKDIIYNGIYKMKNNLWQDCKALWKLWIPGSFIIFGLLPLHYRLPFAAGVSFLWTCYLSFLRGDYQTIIVTQQQT